MGSSRAGKTFAKGKGGQNKQHQAQAQAQATPVPCDANPAPAAAGEEKWRMAPGSEYSFPMEKVRCDGAHDPFGLHVAAVLVGIVAAVEWVQ